MGYVQLCFPAIKMSYFKAGIDYWVAKPNLNNLYLHRKTKDKDNERVSYFTHQNPLHSPMEI